MSDRNITSLPTKARKHQYRNFLITAAFLLLGMLLSSLLLLVDHTGGFVNMIFVLMVVVVARLTEGYFWGILASFCGVIFANYIFTYPYWQLDFTIAGYPLTFITMLTVSLIVSALTSRVKRQERIRLEAQQEAMRANLLRAVSHDLRTPLTSIAGSTSAILENDSILTQEQKNTLLRGVRDEAQWLIRMVENLLSITRMGDTQAQLHKEVEIAEELLSSASMKFQKRFPDMQLDMSLPMEPIFIPIDAILIEQVLMNLLENAVYHSNCTKIDLDVRAENGMAVFSVTDNGCGIPPERLSNLLTSGKYGDVTGGDNRRNMGIGLSVCTSIIKAHSGTMSVENIPGGGASFHFAIPLAEHITEELYEDQG